MTKAKIKDGQFDFHHNGCFASVDEVNQNKEDIQFPHRESNFCESVLDQSFIVHDLEMDMI